MADKKQETIEDVVRKKAAIEADALEVGGIVGASRATADKSSAVGNAAKLREALMYAEQVLDTAARNVRGETGMVINSAYSEAARKCRAALAAPPRNCDKYATADEALKAQEQMFNDSNFTNGECKLGCPECDNPRVGCKIAWLFAPATEQEGGAR